MRNSQPDHQNPTEPLSHLPDPTVARATADTEFLPNATPAPAAQAPASGQTQPLPRTDSYLTGGGNDYRHPAEATAAVPVWSASDMQPDVARAVRPLALVWALLVIAAGVGLAFAAAGYRPNLQFSFVGLLAFVGGAFVVAALLSLLPKKKQR